MKQQITVTGKIVGLTNIKEAILQQEYDSFNNICQQVQECRNNDIEPHIKSRLPKHLGGNLTPFKEGHKAWNKGLPRDRKTRLKISNSLKGKSPTRFTPDVKKICIVCNKFFYSKPYRRKKICSNECRNILFKNNGEKTRFSPSYRPNFEKAVKTLQTETNRERMRLSRRNQRMPKFKTKPEKMFLKICEENNLPFTYTGDGKVWIGNRNPDFLDEKNKNIVEIFGVYWHSIQKGISQEEAERKIKQHYRKYGYTCTVLWADKNGAINIAKRVLGSMSSIGASVIMPRTIGRTI